MIVIRLVLAYILALVGGLVVLMVASPLFVMWGLGTSLLPPTGLLWALPFAIAASVVPYICAVNVLWKVGLQSQRAHILAGCAVTVVAIALFWLVMGGGLAPSILLSERSILGTLLAGAVAGFIHYQIQPPRQHVGRREVGT